MDMNDIKSKIQGLTDSIGKRHVDTRWIILMALFAVLLVAAPVLLKVKDVSGRKAANEALTASQGAVGRMGEAAALIQRTLDDETVHQLALSALSDSTKMEDLKGYITGRDSEIEDVQVFSADLENFNPLEHESNGFALIDMMLAAQDGLNPPMQMHSSLQPPKMFDLTAVRQDEKIAGYLAVMVDPQFLLSRLNPEQQEFDYMSLSQNNGRQPSTVLQQYGTLESAGRFTEKLAVAGTLFRVELPLVVYTEFLGGFILTITTTLGLLMLLVSGFLLQKSKQWKIVYEQEQQEQEFAAVAKAEERDAASVVVRKPKPQVEIDQPEEAQSAPELPEPPPMRLRYDINERHTERSTDVDPVELTSEIFRAYDIRGIVGKSLDAGVAEKVGKVLGTLALERDAGPVVVARDGRGSGPGLVAGMIEGVTSTGCNVLNIGAVPTGVLYYAAHEMASGSAVMITGSHNPPDYNGFKIMVGGDTLFGDQIRTIYQRIMDEEYAHGEGSVEEMDVLQQYIDRIASDIQIERPLKAVIDCGNGIGGVCAADVLRAIGAEALPLFDEVDGTFPNHHPDPSDPDNLKDLIEAVRFMDADIGLALDGDADRLGVVTRDGSIIYPDRVMMLLAMDVLDREPGATIIYDVKCTGHLAEVIEMAGGKPQMYKTGHSVIKARMKEIGSPFGGEMSGHFFFGERWYGVDDGIYAAARLLEILAGMEAEPEEVLKALPTSFSTPELKVHMQEGETHAFIDKFQASAHFEGATVTTIDGVRADYPDGWGLVRASNTTPILVVRFDGESEEALERLKTLFRARMLAVNPDLELPF
jgi:phosphomannomutase